MINAFVTPVPRNVSIPEEKLLGLQAPRGTPLLRTPNIVRLLLYLVFSC